MTGDGGRGALRVHGLVRELEPPIAPLREPDQRGPESSPPRHASLALSEIDDQVWSEAEAGCLTVATVRAVREAAERGLQAAAPAPARARRGRPAKAVGEKRNRALWLALSTVEAAVLEATAKDAGKPVVDVVREALFGAPLPGLMAPLSDGAILAALAACERGLWASVPAAELEPLVGELERLVQVQIPAQRGRILERLEGRRGAALKVSGRVLATKVQEDLRPISEFRRLGIKYRPAPQLVSDEARRGHPNGRRREANGSVRLAGTTLRVRLTEDELQLLKVVSAVLEASVAAVARQALFGTGLPPSQVPAADEQLLSGLARCGAGLRSLARSHAMGSDEHAAYYRLALRCDELGIKLAGLYRHQRRVEAARERQAQARSRAMWAAILGGRP